MIKTVIDNINTSLETLNHFEKFIGLTEIIKKGDKSFPAQYCGNDNYNEINDFDFKKGQVYHRLTGPVSRTRDDTNNADSCEVLISAIFPLRMILFTPRSILGKENDDQYADILIAENVINTIETQNNQALALILKAEVVSIQVLTYNTNRYEVFAQEYEGLDMEIPFKSAYISIDYQVNITGGTNCFDITQCP